MRPHFAFALILASLVFIACNARANGFEPLDKPSKEYAELEAVMKHWRDAVSRKATDVVISHALPEAREVVERALNDKTSSLYLALYGTRTQNFLQNPAVRTLLIPHKDLADHGMGTTACFLGPNQQQPPWPISRDDLREFSREPGVFCIFAFRADRRWYVSYEFGNPEEGGDV